jgi:hypothetical protein
MKEEGMVGNVDIDLDNLPDKEFVTYRQTKTFSETVYFRYNFWSWFGKSYNRTTNTFYE